MNTIITIGREFGSGGRELGRRLSEILGFAYYDEEIITEISKRTQLSEEYVQNIVEHKPIVSFPIHIGTTFQPMVNTPMDQSNAIFREQCNILTEMADKSDCVIVGRCADAILRDKKPFRIFVYADMESKIARCRAKVPDQASLSDKEMAKRILKVDKQRAKYYNFYTEQVWGSRENYDVCVNTSGKSIKELAEFLAKLL